MTQHGLPLTASDLAILQDQTIIKRSHTLPRQGDSFITTHEFLMCFCSWKRRTCVANCCRFTALRGHQSRIPHSCDSNHDLMPAAAMYMSHFNQSLMSTSPGYLHKLSFIYCIHVHGVSPFKMVFLKGMQDLWGAKNLLISILGCNGSHKSRHKSDLAYTTTY